MKFKRKRALLRFTSAVLALALLPLFSACSHDGRKQNRIREPEAVDHVWHADCYSLSEDIGIRTDTLTIQGNTAVMNGARVISEDPYAVEDLIVRFDLTTKEFTWEPVPSPLDSAEVGHLYHFLPLADGSCVCLYRYFNENTREETLTLAAVNTDGSLRFRVDGGLLFDGLPAADHLYINRLLSGENGTLYLITDSAIAAVSPENGQRLWLSSERMNILESGATADGRVYITYSGTEGTKSCFLDDAEKGPGADFPMPEGFTVPDNSEIKVGVGHDLYYTAGDGLYAIDRNDTEPTLLCSWLNSDLDGNMVEQTLQVLSADKLLYFDSTQDRPRLALLTPTAPEDVKPKLIIRLGNCNYNNTYYLNLAVLAFNSANDTYRIVVEDYSRPITDTVGQMAEEKLAAAIASDDSPDILLCGMTFDASLFVGKGLFLDLYPFLKQKDSPLHRKDILPCVFTAMEEKDGTLPLIPGSFTMSTLYIDSEKTGGKTVWTLDDYMHAAESLSDGQYLMRLNTRFTGDPSSALLGALLPYTMDSFVDERKMKCSFDSEAFGRFLVFCRDCPILELFGKNDTPDTVRRGNLLLADTMENVQNDLYAYIHTRYYAFGGKHITAIGYPVTDRSDSGTVMSPVSLCGITADSPVADGAWQFLCQFLGDPTGGASSGAPKSGDIPAAAAAFEKMMETERTRYYAFRETGMNMLSAGPDTTEEEIEEWGKQKGGVPGHMTEEDEQNFRALVNGITRAWRPVDTAVTDMILEDASAFFAGAKTLEETKKIIQGRMSIYLSETKG